MSANETAAGSVELSRFPGLRPFEPDEKPLFFGRKVEAETLLFSVLGNRVTLLYGHSGSGKSSLINCALTPALIERGNEVVRLRIDFSHTAGRPRLIGTCPSSRSDCDARIELPATDAKEPNLSVRDLIRQLDEHFSSEVGDEEVTAPRKVILIFDQFEEIFQQQFADFRPEVMNFLADLRRNKDYLWHVLLSLRSEYVGYLAKFSEYVRGVFDAPLLIRPLNAEQASEVIRRTAEMPQEFEDGSKSYVLDSASFEIDGETVQAIVEECRTNVGSDGVNMLLLQLIGSTLVDEFVATDASHRVDRVTSRHLTKDWFRRTKTRNVELLIDKAVSKRSDRRAAFYLLKRLIDPADGKRQIVRRGPLTQLGGGGITKLFSRISDDSLNRSLKRLVRKQIVREEELYSDKRYEIAHDFIADTLWQRFRRGKWIRRAGASIVAFALFAIAVGVFWQIRASQKADLAIQYSSLQQNISTLNAKEASLLDAIAFAEQQAGQAGEQVLKERSRSCALQHRLFQSDWNSANWGGAQDSLIETLGACKDAGRLSPSASRLLSGVLESFFQLATLSAKPSPSRPAGIPAWFADRNTLITHQLVVFNLQPAASVEEYLPEADCAGDIGCAAATSSIDRFLVSSTDGSRRLVYVCAQPGTSSDPRAETAYLSAFECDKSEPGDANQVSLANVVSALHPLVTLFDFGGDRYLFVGRQGTDLVCGLDGACAAVDGMEIQRALISAVAIRSATDTTDRSDDHLPVLFAADSEGFIYRFRLRVDDCPGQCPDGAIAPTAKLVRFIRGHVSAVTSLQLADINGAPLLLSSSEDGSVTARDQHSLEMLGVYSTPGGRAIQSILVDAADERMPYMIGMDRDWTIHEWPLSDIPVRIRPVPGMTAQAIAIAPDESLYVGGYRDTVLADGAVERRPAISRFTEMSEEDCFVPESRDGTAFTVERLAIAPDGSNAAAALANYGQNRGRLLLAAQNTDGCGFGMLGNSTVAKQLGSTHGLDFVNNSELIASDFRGSIWRARRRGEQWQMEQRRLFPEKAPRIITSVVADAERNVLIAGVRRKDGNLRILENGCVLSMEYDRVWSSSSQMAACRLADNVNATRHAEELAKDKIRWVSIADSGDRIAIAGDRVVQVNGLDSPEFSQSLSASSNIVWRAAFALGDEVLIGATYAGTLEFWDVQSGTNLLTFRLPVADKSTNTLLDLAVECSAESDHCHIAVPLKIAQSVADIRIRVDSDTVAAH